MLQGTCEEMTILQNFDLCEVSLLIACYCSQLDSVVQSLLGWRGTGLHPEGFVLSCYFKNRFAKEMLRGENRVFQHTQVEAGISNWAHWAIFAHDSSVKTRQFYPRTAKKKSATTWQVHFWCRSQFFPSWPIGLSVSISSTLWKINPAACSVCRCPVFLGWRHYLRFSKVKRAIQQQILPKSKWQVRHLKSWNAFKNLLFTTSIAFGFHILF